ncbi:hypothetical protein KEG57_13385 [Polyangium jinanense]|uniref:GYF domain-containing protein n=1 Tax=Polyangium jinanense TaxID=2829994 RepID=A0A9X4ASU6_9BACT|nr:hypothetical protein [Polyangium jinanense]
MRYYVTIQSGEEKGPYEENEVRAWLAAGTMPRTAPTRAEQEALARPAWEVFPGVAPGELLARVSLRRVLQHRGRSLLAFRDGHRPRDPSRGQMGAVRRLRGPSDHRRLPLVDQAHRDRRALIARVDRVAAGNM